MTKEELMKRAISNGKYGFDNNFGGPFGALIVDENIGEIISEGYNTVIRDKDPTAHAEINAIRLACKKLNTFDLSEKSTNKKLTLYTSCYPCTMCLSAIMWSRLNKVVYSGKEDDALEIGFDDSVFRDEIKNNKFTFNMEEFNSNLNKDLFEYAKEKGINIY